MIQAGIPEDEIDERTLKIAALIFRYCEKALSEIYQRQAQPIIESRKARLGY